MGKLRVKLLILKNKKINPLWGHFNAPQATRKLRISLFILMSLYHILKRPFPVIFVCGVAWETGDPIQFSREPSCLCVAEVSEPNGRITSCLILSVTDLLY